MNEIELYGEIGGWFGNDAKSFREKLNSIEGDTVTLRIDSFGGEVFEGFSIYNTILASDKKFKAIIEGHCMSIATSIACACDEVHARSNASNYMIHNPWGWAIGDAKAMRDSANVLETLKKPMISIYNQKTGLDADTLSTMMDQEVFMTGEEAVEKGFVDSVLGKEVKKDDKAQAKYYASYNKNFINENGNVKPYAYIKKENIQGMKNLLNDLDQPKNMEEIKNLSNGIEEIKKEQKNFFNQFTNLIKNLMPKKDIKNLDLTLVSGQTIYIETEEENYAVGDVAYEEQGGDLLSPGHYEVESDGNTIIIGENGKITEIQNTEEMESKLNTLKASFEEKINTLQSSLNQQSKEKENLEKENQEWKDKFSSLEDKINKVLAGKKPQGSGAGETVEDMEEKLKKMTPLDLFKNTLEDSKNHTRVALQN